MEAAPMWMTLRRAQRPFSGAVYAGRASPKAALVLDKCDVDGCYIYIYKAVCATKKYYYLIESTAKLF